MKIVSRAKKKKQHSTAKSRFAAKKNPKQKIQEKVPTRSKKPNKTSKDYEKSKPELQKKEKERHINGFKPQIAKLPFYTKSSHCRFTYSPFNTLSVYLGVKLGRSYALQLGYR